MCDFTYEFNGGICSPPRRKLSPHFPPQKKMAKISHFRQSFEFLPPQNRIFAPSMPLHKKFPSAYERQTSGETLRGHNCVHFVHRL